MAPALARRHDVQQLSGARPNDLDRFVVTHMVECRAHKWDRIHAGISNAPSKNRDGARCAVGEAASDALDLIKRQYGGGVVLLLSPGHPLPPIHRGCCPPSWLLGVF